MTQLSRIPVHSRFNSKLLFWFTENLEVQSLGEGVGDVTGIAVEEGQLPSDGGHDPGAFDGLETGLKGGGRGPGRSARASDALGSEVRLVGFMYMRTFVQ